MDVLQYAAFSPDPLGGNPAGVVLDATGLDAQTMLSVAAEVGFSETAFVTSRDDGELDVRYFSPRMEVPFCGHATIATAVAYAERHGVGSLIFHTPAGIVPVRTRLTPTGTVEATLVSVAPRSKDITVEDLDELLKTLH